ncbi:PTS sugar transporter subunit IIA [Falsiroseomonas sp. HW251]|uniref:PTS sugar transporter subunit IIA n=1 Tax=Falsiroseomonas sp. HW251 TaxID=3390998 RepID=UPI003D3109CB
MGIAEYLAGTDVFLNLGATTKRGVLQMLAAEAGKRLDRPASEILQALQAREDLGSTALGRGVALPHAQVEGDPHPVALFARLSRPVDYEARDDEPVDLVILVLWPRESPEGFLPTLAETCRVLRESQVLRRLRSAQTPDEVIALLSGPPTSDDGMSPEAT